MRQQVEVEKLNARDPAQAGDTQQMADWMTKLAHRNDVDPAIFDYPSLEILKAQRGDESLVYLPRHLCYLLESLAINPDNEPQDTAAALKALFVVVHYDAKTAGLGETYFLCRDAETCKFVEHQSFEEMTGAAEHDALREAATRALDAYVSGDMGQAMSDLDDAVNAVKLNPRFRVYRKRHIRPKLATPMQAGSPEAIREEQWHTQPVT